jgi:hypothetical protein
MIARGGEGIQEGDGYFERERKIELDQCQSPRAEAIKRFLDATYR